MAPGVSIVIPTWNGLTLLERFLPSALAAASHYLKQSGAATEVIVVDDGSTDRTAQWLMDRGFIDTSVPQTHAAASLSGTNHPTLPSDQADRELHLRLVRNEMNLGFGETCNRGAGAASHPLVFLLNNDVEVSIDAIAPLVENFADRTVFAAHCRVIDLESGQECGTGKLGNFSRGFIRVHGSYTVAVERAHPRPLYSMFAGGGSAMFDREKFRELGGFEPLLSPFYWEDVELSYRAWKRGLTVLYEPRSVVRHRVSSTIGKLKRSRVRRIEQRNRLIYHWIHLQDGRLLTSHVAWTVLLTLTAPLRLSPLFIASVAMALSRMPAIRKRRRQEKSVAKRTDREVYEVFEEREMKGEE